MGTKVSPKSTAFLGTCLPEEVEAHSLGRASKEQEGLLAMTTPPA